MMSESAKSLRVDLILKIEFNEVNKIRWHEATLLREFKSSSVTRIGDNAEMSFHHTDADAVIGMHLVRMFVLDQVGRQSLAAATYQHVLYDR